MTSLQDILSKKRSELEYSQVEMAAALKITPRMYQRLEAGDTKPKGTVLKKYLEKIEGIGKHTRNFSAHPHDKDLYIETLLEEIREKDGKIELLEKYAASLEENNAILKKQISSNPKFIENPSKKRQATNET